MTLAPVAMASGDARLHWARGERRPLGLTCPDVCGGLDQNRGAPSQRTDASQRGTGLVTEMNQQRRMSLLLSRSRGLHLRRASARLSPGDEANWSSNSHTLRSVLCGTLLVTCRLPSL